MTELMQLAAWAIERREEYFPLIFDLIIGAMKFAFIIILFIIAITIFSILFNIIFHFIFLIIKSDFIMLNLSQMSHIILINSSNVQNSSSHT